MEKRLLEIITSYFKTALAPKEMEDQYNEYKPTPMKKRFDGT